MTSWLFTQVWVWSGAAFALGGLVTWLLFVRPLRRRLSERDEELAALEESVADQPVAEASDRTLGWLTGNPDGDDDPPGGEWNRARPWVDPVEASGSGAEHGPVNRSADPAAAERTWVDPERRAAVAANFGAGSWSPAASQPTTRTSAQGDSTSTERAAGGAAAVADRTDPGGGAHTGPIPAEQATGDPVPGADPQASVEATREFPAGPAPDAGGSEGVSAAYANRDWLLGSAASSPGLDERPTQSAARNTWFEKPGLADTPNSPTEPAPDRAGTGQHPHSRPASGVDPVGTGAVDADQSDAGQSDAGQSETTGSEAFWPSTAGTAADNGVSGTPSSARVDDKTVETRWSGQLSSLSEPSWVGRNPSGHDPAEQSAPHAEGEQGVNPAGSAEQSAVGDTTAGQLPDGHLDTGQELTAPETTAPETTETETTVTEMAGDVPAGYGPITNGGPGAGEAAGANDMAAAASDTRGSDRSEFDTDGDPGDTDPVGPSSNGSVVDDSEYAAGVAATRGDGAASSDAVSDEAVDSASSPLPRRTPGAAARPGPGGEILAGGVGPLIKGHAGSRQYHTPDSPQYDQIVADVWFRNESDAEIAGFSSWDGR